MTRGFAFGDLAVVVEGADRDLQTWLGEFLEPHFEPRAAGARTWRIGVVEDQRRYLAALTDGPAEGTLDAFTLDAGPLRLPRWHGPGTRLFDARRRLVYEIAAASPSVTILSAPRNEQLRSALMAVARELATDHVQRAGGLLLHASAFGAKGRTVLVCGPKRAGKTTLLVHALRTGAVQYVANDRVMVLPGAPPVRARGVPTAVRIRRGTLDLFPSLAERLDPTAYEYRLTLQEAAAAPVPEPPRSGARRLSPAQFCRVLDVASLAEGEIAALVFPRIGEEPGGASLRRLTATEVGAHLETAIFGARSERWTSDAFTLPADPPGPDRAEIGRRCRALADAVPGHECRLGPASCEDPRGADELVARLLS